MSKDLVVVYQDCPTCGNRKEWGERTVEVAKKSGLDIRYVSFATTEGQKLCKLAIYAGVGRLPFITNGEKFSDNIEDFIEAEKAPKSFAKAIEDEAFMTMVAEKADELQQKTLKTKKRASRKKKVVEEPAPEEVEVDNEPSE